MTLTIPISRFRRLLFAVLQAIAPARASAAAHAQLSQLYDRWGYCCVSCGLCVLYTTKAMQRTYCRTPFCSICALLRNWNHRRTKGVAAAGCHQPEQNKLNSAGFKRTDTLEKAIRALT